MGCLDLGTRAVKLKGAECVCSQPVLEQAKRFVLATDNDKPGRALAEELARRFGPERCLLVTWAVPQPKQPPPAWPLPLKLDAKPPKDANDVLMAAGREAVQACIRSAQPYPVPGLARYAFRPQ